MSKTSIYKSFLVMPEGKKWKVLDITGRAFGTFQTQRGAFAAIDAFIREKWKRNPYDHERIRSPRALAREGLTKYRSVRTPKGDIVRIAFPAGRRRSGSGKVQAILHRENPRHGNETEIYGTVKEIVAVKGPGHKCDAACRRAGHTYVHKFTKRAGVYGLPDGSLKIHS